MSIAKSCEFLAHWVGGVSWPELSALHGLTPRRLTDLARQGLDRLGRATVAYDPRTKRHHTTVPTSQLHGPNTVAAAVTVIQAARLWNTGTGRGLLCPVEDIRHHRRQPAPDTFRVLLAACTRRQVVDVTYVAKQRQHTVLFSPHTLVVATHRLHFRGYSSFEREGRQEWWDLVPSRVIHAEPRPRSGYVGMEGDAEWNNTTDVRLRLRGDLPRPLAGMVRFEHGMDGDELVLHDVRQALKFYVVSDHIDRRYFGHPASVWQDEASNSQSIQLDQATTNARQQEPGRVATPIGPATQ